MFLTVIKDGTEHHIETEGGLLKGILRDSRIPFSFPCAGAGICGKCKALISEDGEIFRERLVCKTYAKDKMVVKLPDQSKKRPSITEISVK
ncbi:MAG: 2Fe-2S iron-sulfur cluster binding domain-containing protein, partial [Lachnospiraceae bacterium]|nr:2Fe-2S iron-sulfur cluster binding domain-containing protein [Lachnospiraceae bacterium]